MIAAFLVFFVEKRIPRWFSICVTLKGDCLYVLIKYFDKNGTITYDRTKPDIRWSSRGRMGRGSIVKIDRNSKMWLTGGWTDGPTGAGRCRVACLWLTRPDTRPPVADGWAGAFSHFSTRAWRTGRRTNGPTDQRTDGRTKPLIELRVRN